MKVKGTAIGIGLVLACSFAATLQAQDLFVANGNSGTIGEYGLDGRVVNASLITGLNCPVAAAISGGHLFVVNACSGTVGEYTTAGATVNASLITGLGTASGIAISGKHLFVMNVKVGVRRQSWSAFDFRSPRPGTVLGTWE